MDSENIPATATYLKDMFESAGNPMGIDPELMSNWAKNLNLSKQGEILFYAGMYPNMGYLDVLVKIMELFTAHDIDTNKMIKLSQLLQKFGFGKSVISMLNTVKKTPNTMIRLAVGKNATKETIEEAKSILSHIEELNEKYNKTLILSVKVLQKLGIDIYYLGSEEPDSGATLHTYGYIDYYKKQSSNVYTTFKKYNVKKLVSSDPISIGIMRKYYPRFLPQFDVKLMHFSELVLLYLKEEHIVKKLDKTVTIHDPCALARYFGVTEPIRTLLSKIGLKVIEVKDNKELTRCCGAGGLEFIYPQVSREMSKERSLQLVETKAELIVSPCAVCRSTLNMGLNDIKDNREVLDIPDLVAEAMGINI
ncbi:MAG: (Fe-S)-binding protein [Caldisphaera sp.]